MDEPFEFINNQKNKRTLSCNGFLYTKNVTNKNGSTQWRCINRKECSASVTIDETKKVILRDSKKHACQKDEEKSTLDKWKRELKQAVCEDLGPIQKIYERKVQEMCSDDVPGFHTIKDTLYRARKKFLNTDFLNHNTTENIHIPEALAKNFLRYEDGTDKKILIFVTSVARKMLRGRQTFFADGTFKAAPKPFYQLYVLHFDLYSDEKVTNIVPAIYVLLPDKSEHTYTRLFSVLKENLGIDIQYFKSDYEKAQMNAVATVFPDAIISGCFHHFIDAIWKYSKKIKLNTTKEGRNVTRMCALIPLLPANRIPGIIC